LFLAVRDPSIGHGGELRIWEFYSVTVRLPSFDLADGVLDFLTPTVVIGILGSLLASFIVAFANLLLLVSRWPAPSVACPRCSPHGTGWCARLLIPI